MINFTGKKVLITGASGGIGDKIAKSMHKLGAFVFISGTNEDKLKLLGNELKSNYEIKICDLSDFKACGELINSLPHLDILVCNAGITQDTLAIRMTDEMFGNVIDVNLKASFILNREALKKMMKAKWGRIINISSVVAVSGNPGQANYCAAKAGLIGMSKSLAIEYASKGITVNVVAPGFIETQMTQKLNEVQKEAILQKIPVKKMGQPEDIASAVAFLASDQASYITGQTIHVNGGMLMI